MKNWIVLFFICCLANNFSQTSISPQFSELNGMEDQFGNTHLFYRIYTSGYGTMGNYYSNSIYRLNPVSGDDNFFLGDGGFADQFDQVNDYEFWENDFNRYIYAGTHIYLEPFPEVYRYDQMNPIFSPQMWGVSRNLELSKQDTNIIIVSVDNGFNYRSTDWGNNWDSISLGYEILSLSPFNHNIFFAAQGLNLLKSTNGGSSFFTVDTGKIYSPNFIYDTNGLHIYALNSRFGNHLVVSNNKGEAFSWQTKYSSDSEIFISIDESISGTVYLADKKNILVSTDYGDNFSLYKSLNRRIVGIYKKPNSNKLYAATKYIIYEITPDTVQVIKSLPIPEEAFDWFPLNLGDRWIYLNTFYGDLGDSSRSISIKEVIGYKTVENKVYNELLVTEFPLDTSGLTVTHSQFFRVDSSSGLVTQAWIENDSLLLEKLYTDLLAEVGDTIPVGNGIYLESEVPFTIFGLDSRKRTFSHVLTPALDMRLVKDLGLTYQYVWELLGVKAVLQGCVIDGEVYGDTTLVSVDTKSTISPTEFILEQNYSNPFNPSTVISYRLPVTSTVTLKVYDILGNEIATLVNEEKPAGEYEVEFNASSDIRNLVSGIYFYQLRAGDFVQTKKMILLR